ncbi:YidC/Oxa1 family insertase periplasmic-domain containing protein [bacterium]|nr:MAG: YidC/Oxa1 family insertase periplasmic-domain containing protein [bacterium]
MFESLEFLVDIAVKFTILFVVFNSIVQLILGIQRGSIRKNNLIQELQTILVSSIGGGLLVLLMQFVLGYMAPQLFVNKQPDVQEVYARPLVREISFIQEKQTVAAQTKEIQTAWGILLFSSHGGSLDRLDIQKTNEKNTVFIRTVAPIEEYPFDSKTFLIACDGQTPFEFELKEYAVQQDGHKLVYQAHTKDYIISKTFLINQEKPFIDCTMFVNIVRESDEEVVRFFIRAPSIASESRQEFGSSVIIDASQAFVKKSLEKIDLDESWTQPGLIGADNKYFVHACIAENKLLHRAYFVPFGKYQRSMILESKPFKKAIEWNMRFFMGSKNLEVVRSVDARLEKTVDYAGWFERISKALLWGLKYIYNYCHSYGIAITILTLLLKLLLLPFSLRSESSMRKHKEFEKQMKYIDQRYKNDPAMLDQERAALVKKYGLPGLGSCLPLLIQIPFFPAFSKLLSSSIELYHESFLWLPDLSARDPWYILPLIITFCMVSMGLNADEKQRFMLIAVGLIMGAFMANVASGLALFIAVNLVIGIVQTKVTDFFKRSV